MDLSEHSLRRDGARITQEGAAAEEVPMVNPDPMVNADQRVNPDLSTEAPFTPDTPPEGGWPWEQWDSPEVPTPTLVTPPDVFRAAPEGQPMADAPSPEDIIEYAWSTCSPGLHRARPS